MSRVTEIFSLKIACPNSDLSIFLKIFVFYMAAFMRGFLREPGVFSCRESFLVLFLLWYKFQMIFSLGFAAEVAFAGTGANSQAGRVVVLFLIVD
ncbi:hypothetical protein [Faecalispora jeddahensis]|uniref:hypothetical protein n=1 Tax=Faecalispora jeddahensis TaxID=1414721 RepID=UPI0004BA67FE|nr:hypothetical protein [Faecalispora jeddahensis]